MRHILFANREQYKKNIFLPRAYTPGRAGYGLLSTLPDSSNMAVMLNMTDFVDWFPCTTVAAFQYL
jgi:hypothetical protein